MKNQIILVTGASSGIGKATALELIKQGHTVYGAARRVEKMAELEKAGGHTISMDVTDAEQVKASVDHIISEHGRLDVLVNNAGYGLYGSVEDTSMEDARHQFEVNLFGMATVTKAVLPHMRKAKNGKVINTSSMGGKIYTPLGSWYHATKHAVEGWSDCLRLELKPFGIQVVIIEPGVILTDFGNVTNQPMLDRSKGSPYESLANQVAKTNAVSYGENGNGSSPQVIANVIANAVRSKKPKTRYAKGKYAKPLIWVRTYLGDRIYDRMVMNQIN